MATSGFFVAFAAGVECGGMVFEKNIVRSVKKTCKRFCHSTILSVTLWATKTQVEYVVCR